MTLLQSVIAICQFSSALLRKEEGGGKKRWEGRRERGREASFIVSVRLTYHWQMRCREMLQHSDFVSVVRIVGHIYIQGNTSSLLPHCVC